MSNCPFKPGDEIEVAHDRPPANEDWPRPPIGTRARFIGFSYGFCRVEWLKFDERWSHVQSGWSTSRFRHTGGPW